MIVGILFIAAYAIFAGLMAWSDIKTKKPKSPEALAREAEREAEFIQNLDRATDIYVLAKLLKDR